MPSATSRHSATPEAVSCMLMAWNRLFLFDAFSSREPGSTSLENASHLENHPFVTKQSWRLVIKLSSIIDNLVPARPMGMTGSDNKGENARRAHRKAAMAVLAHSDAAEISGRLGRITLPTHEN